MIPILLLVAGLVLVFVTKYDTLGIIIAALGGVYLLVQFVFLAVVAAAVTSTRVPRKYRRRRKP